MQNPLNASPSLQIPYSCPGGAEQGAEQRRQEKKAAWSSSLSCTDFVRVRIHEDFQNYQGVLWEHLCLCKMVFARRRRRQEWTWTATSAHSRSSTNYIQHHSNINLVAYHIWVIRNLTSDRHRWHIIIDEESSGFMMTYHDAWWPLVTFG